MEKIYIKNFGGITKADIEIKPFTVFIGEQSSGKSVVAKLVYFCRTLMLELYKQRTPQGFVERTNKRFKKYFPSSYWPQNEFTIQYEFGNKQPYAFIGKNGDLQISLPKDVVQDLGSLPSPSVYEILNSETNANDTLQSILLKYGFNQTNLFVPASRSIFAHVERNSFSYFGEDTQFDPFFIEFGQMHQAFKGAHHSVEMDGITQDFWNKASGLLKAKFLKDQTTGEEYLVHEDGRKVGLAFASSGQQELLPLLLILARFNGERFKDGHHCYYIEEPEAHLFPNAQKQVTDLLAWTFNNKVSKNEFIITTHSPYILASLNNLLQAGNILVESPEKAEQLYEIVGKDEVMNLKDLGAYEIKDGKVNSIIDQENGLILAEYLDGVSDEIGEQFDRLLDLSFGEDE
ncbi:hypothetical protein FUAX_28640 [Fulvitalea axinellae]|uniref:Endonuclease GajA/Old nuclease/RecF-like AAA domain-containing protein n=1 Tax=Fulvitalea axinellae TaxID=1182444 RepID=A0AAU9CY76_9BACT|nr:hypothetical protein FUAX_28640 [Fulvitalea axinellae]